MYYTTEEEGIAAEALLTSSLVLHRPFIAHSALCEGNLAVVG